MPWKENVWQNIGKPVGISFNNGEEISGVLCNISGAGLAVMEYLSESEFAIIQYPFDIIRDVEPFPECYYNPALKP